MAISKKDSSDETAHLKQLHLLLPMQEFQYKVFIGKGSIESFSKIYPLDSYSKIFVITDKTIARYHLPKLIKGLLPHRAQAIIVDPGEQYKNISTTQTIWLELLRLGADRNSCIINLGGGVICDMGGFAASTYMRGIDFVQIPTTLLSQVDASVGGKVAIDFANIKNLIGSFQQPRAVLIDPNTLATLSPREYLSGFAEIIKHGLIHDKKYFEHVTEKYPKDYTEDALEEIIEKSCKIKASIVIHDEKEGGQRKLLNFGHTIGHAIESLSQNTDFPLLHGEAISIGMVAEAKISEDIGMLSSENFQIIENSLLKAGLPIRLASFDGESSNIMNLLKADKKNKSGKVLWTLLKNIGTALYDQEVTDAVAKKGINYVLTSQTV